MKRLYILRHALTQPASEGGDRERQLMPQGLQDAEALGYLMLQKKYVPDFIFCSPTTRTRQTLDQISAGLGKIPVRFDKIIYEGGYSSLLKLIQATDNNYESLLVVGHNPSIHQLAASLTGDDGVRTNELAMGYAPCTLTVLDMPHASWADLQPGDNKLIDLIIPEN